MSQQQTFDFKGRKTLERKNSLLELFQSSIMTSIKMIQDMKQAVGYESDRWKARARQEFIRNIENSIERERKIIEEINNWPLTP
jgi:hypothetical protein